MLAQINEIYNIHYIFFIFLFLKIIKVGINITNKYTRQITIDKIKLIPCIYGKFPNRNWLKSQFIVTKYFMKDKL